MCAVGFAKQIGKPPALSGPPILAASSAPTLAFSALQMKVLKAAALGLLREEDCEGQEQRDSRIRGKDQPCSLLAVSGIHQSQSLG